MLSRHNLIQAVGQFAHRLAYVGMDRLHGRVVRDAHGFIFGGHGGLGIRRADFFSLHGMVASVAFQDFSSLLLGD